MRGIRRSIKYEGIVDSFSQSQELLNGKSIFPTMREFLCFAAVLGFQFNKRIPFDENEKTTEIDGRTFAGHPTSMDILSLLALADTKNADILKEKNENDSLEIFEEYANGGLEIISSWLKQKSDDTIGHKALMAAFSKEGFLNKSMDVGDNLSKVQL